MATAALILKPRGEDSIDQYMAEVSRFPLLSREDEVRLARQLRDDGDIAVAHKLVVSNLRFVVRIAHEYSHYGLKLLDLIQEGNMGLMVAVKKFDPEKGYRLISYAVWWIRAHILSFILRSWSLVKLGAGRVRRKLFFKLRSERVKAERDLQSRDEGVTAAKLAERLGVEEVEVLEMEMRLAARDFSLDGETKGEGKSTFLEVLPTTRADQESDFATAEESALVRQTVSSMMGELNEKEQYIVNHRLLTDEPVTLQDIGTNFNVSRERVRQLEERVLEKLRLAVTAAGITQA